MKLKYLLITLAAVLLAACGSGGTSPRIGDGTPLLAFNAALAPSSSLLQDLAVPTAADSALGSQRPMSAGLENIAPDEVFDWAEGLLPQVFSGLPSTQSIGPFSFRYYEGSAVYLAVFGNTVLGLGPITGGQIVTLGTLEAFGCAARPASCGTPMTGVVSRGPALPEAIVTVTDATGAEVCNGTSGPDGRFVCSLPGTARGPFALRAAVGDIQLSSVAPGAYPANTNITPLTTLLVSRLVPTGNPAELATAIASNPSLTRASSLSAAVTQVQRIIAPVLLAAADSTNPLSGTFTAGDSAHARVLSSLQVSIRPEGSAANVEITVKSAPASEDSSPLKITFSSAQAEPPAIPSNAVTPQSLPAASIDQQIADFIARANACYAVPLAQRIRNVPAGATAVVGTAEDVVSLSCKQLFLDHDPTKFKENGYGVGRDEDNRGAFSGLFREGSTGVRFDSQVLQYQRANGDVVITFRAVSTTGAVSYPTPLVLRQQNGVLNAVGNQYEHDMVVRPWFDDREFLLQPEYSYFSTGYTVLLRNKLDNTGKSIYSRVRVIDPQGRARVYLPSPGRTNLISQDKPCCSAQRIASAYQNPSTAGSPATKDTALLFISPQLTDTEILAIPDQGVWKFEIEFADPAKPSVTQVHRTLTRALTLAEVRQIKLFQFTQDYKDELKARADVNVQGAYVFGPASPSQPNVFVIGPASGGAGWTQPDSTVPAATFTTIFGQGGAWDESVGVTASTRRATITCQKSASHCTTNGGVKQFAQGARVHTVELSAVTESQLTLVKSINVYRLP